MQQLNEAIAAVLREVQRGSVVMQPDDTMNIIDLNLVTDIEVKVRSNGRKAAQA